MSPLMKLMLIMLLKVSLNHDKVADADAVADEVADADADADADYHDAVTADENDVGKRVSERVQISVAGTRVANGVSVASDDAAGLLTC